MKSAYEYFILQFVYSCHLRYFFQDIQLIGFLQCVPTLQHRKSVSCSVYVHCNIANQFPAMCTYIATSQISFLQCVPTLQHRKSVSCSVYVHCNIANQFPAMCTYIATSQCVRTLQISFLQCVRTLQHCKSVSVFKG